MRLLRPRRRGKDRVHPRTSSPRRRILDFGCQILQRHLQPGTVSAPLEVQPLRREPEQEPAERRHQNHHSTHSVHFYSFILENLRPTLHLSEFCARGDLLTRKDAECGGRKDGGGRSRQPTRAESPGPHRPSSTSTRNAPESLSESAAYLPAPTGMPAAPAGSFTRGSGFLGYPKPA